MQYPIDTLAAINPYDDIIKGLSLKRIEKDLCYNSEKLIQIIVSTRNKTYRCQIAGR
jgi:hypothetical protein